MAATVAPPVISPIRSFNSSSNFSFFFFVQVTVSQVQEIRDITRIERIGMHVRAGWRAVKV